MKFIDQHPLYNSYSHEIYQINSVNRYFLNELKNLIHSLLMDNDEDEINYNAFILQHRLAAEAKAVPCEQMPYNTILDEIINVFRKMEREGFDSLMDGIAILIEITNNPKEVNEFLKNNSIGYSAEIWSNKINWIPIEGIEKQVASIEEAIEIVEDQFKSTIEHLLQAINQIQKADRDSRKIKDALRDSLSAVEAYVNHIANTTSFQRSCDILLERGILLPTSVRDIRNIWAEIHKNNKDVRHGNEDQSSLSLPEALYYIDRLMAFLKYANRIIT